MAVDAPPASRAVTLEQSMSWLTARLEHFVPGSPNVSRDAQTKRRTELALVTAYLRAWIADGSLPAQRFAPHAGAWQDVLRASCEAPGEARLALRDRRRALYHAQPYLWLRSGGYRLRAWEQSLADLSQRGARPDSVGVLHCLWKAGLVRRQPDWSAAMKRWLTAWGGEATPRDRDAYRITHAAFYVTDFGNQAPLVEHCDCDRLVDLADALLVRALAQERWDLVAELLIALACLEREAPLHARATRAFEARWRPDAGAVDAAFGQRLHTVMVDVLRGAVNRRRIEAIRRPAREASG
jgi:hypothetical protein